MELHITEILEATGGRLLTGTPQGSVTDVSIDSRAVRAGSLFVPLAGTRHDGHAFIDAAFKNGAHAALVQISHPSAASLKDACREKMLIGVDNPLYALGEIARSWRARFTPQVAAITGSNGKTTTKEMAWHIVKRRYSCLKNPGNFNNLIGLPLALFQLDSTHQVAILEMGMNVRGEISRLARISRPTIGLITNIGPAHLEHLKTLAGVQAAKAELFEALESDGIAIINSDDPRVASLTGRTRARILSFGVKRGDVLARNLRADNCCGCSFELCLEATCAPVRLKSTGIHLVGNALAAAALAHALSVDAADIVKGLESFEGVPGRMEIVDVAGIRIINDSYNANPASMQASLRTLSSLPSGARTIAVLGDMLELGKRSPEFHRELGQTVATLHIDCLFLIGDSAVHVREGALKAGMQADKILIVEDMPRLVQTLQGSIREGDALLLKGSRKMQMERVIDMLKHAQT